MQLPLLFRAGLPDRAHELYAEAHELRREQLGSGHPQVADTLNAMLRTGQV